MTDSQSTPQSAPTLGASDAPGAPTAASGASAAPPIAPAAPAGAPDASAPAITVPTDVFLGLGANLGDRRAALHDAVRELRALLADVRVSALYETPPWGDEDQPPFLNAVLRGVTTLAPLDLLDAAQTIEQRLGRVRTARRWGPRAIDIDLLLYGAAELSHPRLTIPHPRLRQRGFVLRPLADLAPARAIPPDHAQIAELLTIVNTNNIRQIAPQTWAD